MPSSSSNLPFSECRLLARRWLLLFSVAKGIFKNGNKQKGEECRPVASSVLVSPDTFAVLYLFFVFTVHFFRSCMCCQTGECVSHFAFVYYC